MKRWSAWWPGEGDGSVPSGFPGEDTATDLTEVPELTDVTEVEELAPTDPLLDDTVQEPLPTEPAPRRSRIARRTAGRTISAMASHWPGQNEHTAPPDFPALVEPAPEGPTPMGPSGAGSAEATRAPFGFRKIAKVVAAVYAALADPLVGGDEAARELRAARVRRAGILAGSAVLLAVVVYATFPVSTYLHQRAATQRAREQLEVISRENERLAEQAEKLRTPEEVEKIARRDYGLVLPGEELYGVLPSPAETTTTTTTVP